MCGICGILEFNKEKEVDERVLTKMNRTLTHRGPDEEGVVILDSVGLGNRRLSIIDLSSGKQPVHNEDKSLWIVFNGEIYNFPQLREKLLKKGHQFYTKTDTETILHLYEEKGEDCVNQLDGMFAFAIWDSQMRRLFLARDPLGKKPLHWAIFDGKFVFGSEIKAILAHPSFKREVDSQSLAKYFLYGFVPAPATIFKDVKKLLPGHFMAVSGDGKVRGERYWGIDYSKKLPLSRHPELGSGSLRFGRSRFRNKFGMTRASSFKTEVKHEIVNLLRGAVETRLISDVPLGVFLSGGVDSGLVVAMMTQLLPPSQINAFTIGFKERSFDESRYAETIAKHLGVRHHLKIFSQKEVLDLVPRVADFLDEPMADPSILPTYLLSSFTKESVKVALSGDGGDENFGGYPKYLAHWFLERTRLNKLPLSPLSRFFPGKLGTFLRHSSDSLPVRNQLWISHFSPGEVERLIGIKPDFEDIEKYHQLFNGRNSLDEAFFLDQSLTLPDLYLVKTDRASMAASLEVRCPFLDKKLTGFCAQVPFKLKLEGFKTKALLKEIAAEFLPKEAIYRSKMGFGIPLDKWLRGELKPLLEETFSDKKIKSVGILDSNCIRNILERGNPNQIWSLFVFEKWRERWLKEN